MLVLISTSVSIFLNPRIRIAWERIPCSYNQASACRSPAPFDAVEDREDRLIEEFLKIFFAPLREKFFRMNWSDKKVLVTGAGGFIGSHLTERLIELGAKTRAFVRYSSTARGAGWTSRHMKNDVEVVLGDIRDQDTVYTHSPASIWSFISLP